MRYVSLRSKLAKEMFLANEPLHYWPGHKIVFYSHQFDDTQSFLVLSVREFAQKSTASSRKTINPSAEFYEIYVPEARRRTMDNSFGRFRGVLRK